MPDPADDDIETRVRNLEGEVVRIRSEVADCRADAAAARVLAGGADRDVSDMRTELRAHTRMLNALRETQVEQGRELTALRGEMQHEIGTLRTEMHQGFATTNVGMARIATLLEGIAEPGAQ